MEQTLNVQNELEMFRSRLKQREEKITQWVTDQTRQMVASQTSKHEEFLREGKGNFSFFFHTEGAGLYHLGNVLKDFEKIIPKIPKTGKI